MIARLVYVMCDECGNPADCADEAKEARQIARHQGFVYRDGRDLCRFCADPEIKAAAERLDAVALACATPNPEPSRGQAPSTGNGDRA